MRGQISFVILFFVAGCTPKFRFEENFEKSTVAPASDVESVQTIISGLHSLSDCLDINGDGSRYVQLALKNNGNLTTGAWMNFGPNPCSEGAPFQLLDGPTDTVQINDYVEYGSFENIAVPVLDVPENFQIVRFIGNDENDEVVIIYLDSDNDLIHQFSGLDPEDFTFSQTWDDLVAGNALLTAFVADPTMIDENVLHFTIVSERPSRTAMIDGEYESQCMDVGGESMQIQMIFQDTAGLGRMLRFTETTDCTGAFEYVDTELNPTSGEWVSVWPIFPVFVEDAPANFLLHRGTIEDNEEDYGSLYKDGNVLYMVATVNGVTDEMNWNDWLAADTEFANYILNPADHNQEVNDGTVFRLTPR